MPTDRQAFLDRPAARLLALLLVILCGGLLAFLHRDKLFQASGSPGDERVIEGVDGDPAAPCISERFADIDGMVEEGVIDSTQAALFKERAEAMCRATTGDGGQAPRLPLE